MNRRIAASVVVGLCAALAGALPAQSATVTASVVYSSDTYMTADFSIHRKKLAVMACATINEVTVNGTDPALPYPGCSGRVESEYGVSYSHDGSTLAKSVTLHTTTGIPPGVNSRVDLVRGASQSSVNVGDLELATNLDRQARYGTRSHDRCVTRTLGDDAAYTGRVDTALTAIAAGPHGSWYVADRDANAIYRIDRSGNVTVLAVLTPVNVTVTRALAADAGWASCTVGSKVAFEAAPTEIEVGSDGTVYVAGQPQLQSGVVAASRVYSINSASGRVKTLAPRYTGPVDLAVGTSGHLFVARPVTGRISVIVKNRTRTYKKLSRVLAVETDSRGRLYASRAAGDDAMRTPGTIVRIY